MSPMAKKKVSYSDLSRLNNCKKDRKGVKCSKRGTFQCPTSNIAMEMKFGTNIPNDKHKKTKLFQLR